MKRFLYHWYVVLIVLITSIVPGCDDEETCFRCAYEKRVSGCNNYAYGAWQSGELAADTEDIRSDLTKEEYCKLVFPSSDIECSSNCCVNFQFRNVKVVPCP